MTQVTGEGVKTAASKHNRVTRPTACVSSPADTRASPRDEINAILERVAARHDITVTRLISHDRRREVVLARDQAIYEVADAFPWMSLPHLGRIFGGRDHTTILHALRKSGGIAHRQWRYSQRAGLRVEALQMGRLMQAIARVVQL